MIAQPRKAVLLTRPADQNQSLFDLLAHLDYQPISFPALSISAAADPTGLDQALAELERFALVVFVSPNAIELALQRLRRSWPEVVPIAVMGPGSRARLAERGIAAPQYQVILPAEADGRFDSEALFKALDIDRLVGQRCLIVRGNGGRNWLFDALKSKQIDVVSVAAYQRSVGQPEAPALQQVELLVEADARVPVLITSSEAIGYLIELFGRHFGEAGSDWLRRQPIIVSHRRIAENATAAGFASVHHADPGDDALARAIECLP